MTEKQLKEEIRKIIKEDIKKDALIEVGTRDWRYLAIKKLWDKGSSFVKKKIGAAIAHNPNANWSKIDDYLKDMDYEEIADAGEMLHIESINESPESYKKELETQLKWIRTKLKSNISDKERARYKKVALDTIHKLKNFSKTGKLEGFERIAGGLSQNMDLNDIAEKHGISIDLMVAEFKKGIATEMEHTNTREVAKEIALDHLFEDPHYYTKLAQIEPVNEDLGGLAVKLIIAPLAAAVIGGLTKYISGEIKQWWRNTKHKREFNQIIDRLRKDPEVVKASKNPKGNFNSLIFSKLKPAEQKFAEFIYKKDFQNESMNEGSIYSSQTWIKKLTPKIEKDVELLKKQFPKYNISLVKNRYETDGSHTLSISSKNTPDADDKKLEKVIASKIKENVNEANLKVIDSIITNVPASTIPPINIPKADVGLGLKMGGEMGNWALGKRHYKLDYQNGKVALVLSKEGKLAMKVRTEKDSKYLDKIQKFANVYLSNYAKTIKKESVKEYIDDSGEERVGAGLPQTKEKPQKKIGEAIRSHNHTYDGTADYNFTHHHKGGMYTPDMGYPAELDTIDFDDDREIEPGHQTNTKDKQKKGYEPVKK